MSTLLHEDLLALRNPNTTTRHSSILEPNTTSLSRLTVPRRSRPAKSSILSAIARCIAMHPDARMNDTLASNFLYYMQFCLTISFTASMVFTVMLLGISSVGILTSLFLLLGLHLVRFKPNIFQPDI